MNKMLITIVTCLMLLPACSSKRGVPTHKTNLSYGMIKSTIKKGRTTQEQVVKTFGSPNVVTKSKNGGEVWTYSKQSSQQKTGGFSAGLLGFGSRILGGGGGSSAYSNTSVETFDLIINFDRNDIVQDYSVVSSKF